MALRIPDVLKKLRRAVERGQCEFMSAPEAKAWDPLLAEMRKEYKENYQAIHEGDTKYRDLAERFWFHMTNSAILISVTADVGMVALVPADIPEAYMNQHVALARPVDAIHKPDLAWYLASRPLCGTEGHFTEVGGGCRNRAQTGDFSRSA